MEAASRSRYAKLSAKVLGPDGAVIEDLGVISEGPVNIIEQPQVPLWAKLLILAALCALGFWLGWYTAALAFVIVFGLVTNVGVAYEAATFAGGASTSDFNYHDSGTGTTAAAVTDTALQTPTGNSRVAGTQSTPGSTNVYQTVATLSYTSSFAITEWGLFSASTSGTLWDHRVFSAYNVVSGNSIQFTYQVTFPSGGS